MLCAREMRGSSSSAKAVIWPATSCCARSTLDHGCSMPHSTLPGFMAAIVDAGGA